MAQGRITFAYPTKISNLAEGSEQHDAVCLVQLDGKFTTSGQPGKAPLLGTDGKLPGSVIPASAGTGTVTSVNGIGPDGDGNVPLSLSATETGPLDERPLAPADATIYIVAGDANPDNDGKVYIYSSSADEWFEVSFMDEAQLDARYLRIDTPITTINNITLGGGATITGLPTPVQDSDAASMSYVDSKNYLSELQDVDLTGLSDGQTIIWNGSAWIPEDLPTGGGGTGPTGPITASEVDFDPIDASPITARNVQAALEQAADLIDGKLNKTGGTVTGSLSVPYPTDIKHAAHKEYVDANVATLSGSISGKLPLAGGTLTGELTLSGAPTSNLHAATKQYVDANVATLSGSISGKLPLAGGTLTGNLTLSDDPESPLHAATKQYVDANFADLPETTSADVGKSPVLDGSGKLHITAMPGGLVKSVNGITPDALGAVAVNLQTTVTGTLAERDEIVSPDDGTLFIVVGDATEANNGKAYLYNASGAAWIEVAPADKALNDSYYVNADGDTMSGSLTMGNNSTVITRAPTVANEVATKGYVDTKDNLKLNLTGGTLTGNLTLGADPTNALHAATKQYVDSSVGDYLPLAGGTLSGRLTLSDDPVNALHAATMRYVDTKDNLKLNLTGGTMTGALRHTSTGGLPSFTTNLNEGGLSHTIDFGSGSTRTSSFSALGIDLDDANGNTDIRPGSVAVFNSFGAPAMPSVNAHLTTKKYVDDLVNAGINNIDLTNYVEKSGSTMTGPLQHSNVSGSSTLSSYMSEAGLSQRIVTNGVTSSESSYSAAFATLESTTGETDIRAGTIGLFNSSGAPAMPTLNSHVTTKKYVDDAVAGATGTGASTAENTTYDATGTGLDSTNVQDAVTELDNKKVSVSGDTMGGPLTLSGAPTSNLHATTKLYVDTITTPLASNVANITNKLNALSSAAVKSVNGALPDSDGDVAISLAKTYTGALNDRPGIVTNPADGDLYIVSGNLVDPDKNGTTYIWSAAANNWLEITSTQTTENDRRYVRKGGDTMTGDLDMTGSKVINIAAPAAPADATNKQYVDSAIVSGVAAVTGNYVSKTVNNTMTAKITSQNPASPGTYFETDPRFGSFDTYEPQGSGRSFTSMYGSTIEQQYRNAAGDTVGGIYIMSKPTGTLITIEGAPGGGGVTPITTIRPNEVTILDANEQPVLQTKPEQLTTKAYVDGAITSGVTTGTSNLMSKTVDNVMTANIRTSSPSRPGNYLETNTRFGMINTYENKVPGSAYSFSSMYGTGVELQHRNADGDTISGVYNRARPDAQGGSYIAVERDEYTTGEYSRTLINTGTIELRNAAGTPTIPTSPFEATTKAYVDSLTDTVGNDLADTNNALSALSNSVVKKVNGVLPGPGGDVAISLSRTYTGPLNNRPAIVPTPADGDIYIVSSDLVQPENNGQTFIWSASGAAWLAVVNPGAAAADARYLQLDGSTPMTGKLDMNDNVITNVGHPLAATDAAHKGYVNDSINNVVGLLRGEMEDYLPKTGGNMTGALIHKSGTLTSNLSEGGLVHTISFGASNAVGTYNALGAQIKDAIQGNTDLRPGTLILTNPDGSAALPTANTHVATKRYVDQQDALKLNLSGGTMTGLLTLSTAPTTDLHAATKQYVDTVTAVTPLDYLRVSFANDYNTPTIVNSSILFNKILTQNGNIAYNTVTGAFLLSAGKTYHLRAIIGGNGTTANSHLTFQWRNAANAGIGGTSTGLSCSMGTRGDAVNPMAEAIYTPNTDENVFLKVTSSQGGAISAKPDGVTGWSSAWATIIQLR